VQKNLRLLGPFDMCMTYILYSWFRTTDVDIQGVSRLVDITAGVEFLGLCDQKSSYKHVSDFERLRSYGRLNLRKEGKDC